MTDTRKENLRVLVLPSSIGLENRVIGGGERYAAEYTRALARITTAEQALFSGTGGQLPEGSPPTRILPWRWNPRSILPPLTRESWRALGEYDVLHVMCFPNTVADGFVASARLRGQLLVLTDIGGGGRCVSSYLNRVSRRLNPYRLADGLAHLSHHAATLFRGWEGHPSMVLHGGARRLFPEGTGRFDGYALFVGRLLEHKGVLEIIEALPAGRRLHVVGRPYDPGYFEALKRAAEGKLVTFLTDADDAELARQYQGASVVLQASLPSPSGGEDRSELLGLVALEAQAAGKPVIVTRTTSLPELVEDGVTGRIVAPRDPGALRAALEEFLGSPDRARGVGHAAERRAAERFTWDAVARRGLEFYRMLLERRRRGG